MKNIFLNSLLFTIFVVYMAMNWTKSSEVVSELDMATGEVKAVRITERNVGSVTSEGMFVKMYMDDIGKLLKVQHKAMLVLMELLKIMDYHNEISVSAGKKREICRALDIYNDVGGVKSEGINVISQYMTHLVKCGLLARKDKGMYIVNPHLFAKCRWHEVGKIRMSVEYSDDGRLITTKFDKNAR